MQTKSLPASSLDSASRGCAHAMPAERPLHCMSPRPCPLLSSCVASAVSSTTFGKHSGWWAISAGGVGGNRTHSVPSAHPPLIPAPGRAGVPLEAEGGRGVSKGGSVFRLRSGLRTSEASERAVKWAQPHVLHTHSCYRTHMHGHADSPAGIRRSTVSANTTFKCGFNADSSADLRTGGRI